MKQPIKIAYCIPGLYAASGMERVLTLKINYLADVLGYDVYVILTEEKELPPYYPLSECLQASLLQCQDSSMLPIHHGGKLYLQISDKPVQFQYI